ncbi:MBL fold metallo-hydrolase [Rhodococcus sp. 14C212]|uniref:MBL fold metallo-hydrolase n=1 Tax=Rhodococcus sp. 14C212 TaxID=2711209 RepID=UPI0013EA3689|nr:MBL fold metallo-hydrolase [Rhodococcus sp. 14C212]NGP04346.1 MBL fold metallo-hydrolase [Rhodococcus sp. 14C212]
MTAVEVVGVVQQEAWRRGELPPVEQVRPGLWSIPVPMPKNPLRYVLVYALALPDGLALIDVGWDSEQSWQALVDGIRQTGHDITEVRFAAITHLHPDHFGLAPRLREVSGAALAMHAADASLLGHHTATDREGYAASWARQLARLGAPEDVRSGEVMELVRFGPRESLDVVLDDGTPLDLPGWDLHAVWTPGHTPGHLCFVDETHELVFSGDHMLPRISPNISTIPGELPNPLHRYLLSLHATTSLPDGEVFPAHEYRFRGVASRAQALLGHHEERLAEIADVVSRHPGSTAWEVSTRISWSRPFETMPPRLRRLAVRETDAHLLVLADREVVTGCGTDPDRWTPAVGTPVR